MPDVVYDAASLPDLLPLYYRRLFPFSQYYRWLSYGGGECPACVRRVPACVGCHADDSLFFTPVHKEYFQNREFSFTLKDDLYVRYQSFNAQSDLEKEMQKSNPYKIDIGAVYTHRVRLHAPRGPRRVPQVAACP